MLIDTHCHVNLMVKNNFETPLQESDLPAIKKIIADAHEASVSSIINIGSSHIDNHDSLLIAKNFNSVFITVGLHPNDGINEWERDIKDIQQWVRHKEEYKIVGIGECGIDLHYPNYNLTRQQDAFKAQIELALEHDLALVVHSRDAYDETLKILEEYRNDITRAVMHCFAYDKSFADIVTSWDFMLGIGGTVTYPKNNELRTIVQTIDMKYIVLETDAPFLPIQTMRGKQNHPRYVRDIAEYIAQLRDESFDAVARQTTENAIKLFKLDTSKACL